MAAVRPGMSYLCLVLACFSNKDDEGSVEGDRFFSGSARGKGCKKEADRIGQPPNTKLGYLLGLFGREKAEESMYSLRVR